MTLKNKIFPSPHRRVAPHQRDFDRGYQRKGWRGSQSGTSSAACLVGAASFGPLPCCRLRLPALIPMLTMPNSSMSWVLTQA